MYTQCHHCKAIFRVDMKEVTSAQGQLRCGECLNTFNAVDSLSTTVPEKFQSTNAQYSDIEKAHINSMDDWQSSKISQGEQQPRKAPTSKQSTTDNFGSADTTKSNNLFLASLFLLTFLLAAQVLYYNPSLYSDNVPKRLPEKVEMLNYNVFAHPNEAGVLLISGSIKNNAKHAQPYPSLEVSLTDAQSNLVGFSRFTPEEYLSNTTSNTALLPIATPVSLRLKIKDPGNAATQFKFSFK